MKLKTVLYIIALSATAKACKSNDDQKMISKKIPEIKIDVNLTKKFFYESELIAIKLNLIIL